MILIKARLYLAVRFQEKNAFFTLLCSRNTLPMHVKLSLFSCFQVERGSTLLMEMGMQFGQSDGLKDCL